MTSLYTAVCIAYPEYTKYGLLLNEAEEYIRGFLCLHCRHDLKMGYIEFDSENIPISEPSETCCGSQDWLIMLCEDYEQWAKENYDEITD